MSPLADSLPPTRYCTACLRDLPLDRFPFRVKGQPARRGKCRDCYRRYMAAYRQRKRARRLDQFTAALAREPSRSKLEALAAIRLHQFGGLDAFMRQWKAQFDAAVQQAPGSRRVLNMLLAIPKMMEAAEANRPPKDDYGLLSEEDLQREHEETLLALIAANPEIALWAARKLGWSVMPPT